MLKRLFIISTLSLLALSSTVHSEISPGNARAQIIDYGIYELVGQSKVIDSKNSTAGKSRRISKINFFNRTTNIPAVLGNRFGYTYKTSGMPSNSIVNLKAVYKHPEFNDKTGYTVKGTRKTDENGAFVGALGYCFDKDFELVPGTWTIELWYEGNMLVSMSFKIVSQI